MKNANATTIIDGPEAVLNCKELNKPIIPEFRISSDRDPKIPNPSDERGPKGLRNGAQVLPRRPRKPLVKQHFATPGIPVLKTLQTLRNAHHPGGISGKCDEHK